MSKSEPVRPLTSPGRSSRLRILYMEDDLGLARLTQKRLERVGYTVDLAHDGEEGLAMHDAAAYDVVAVDQSMPLYDGLEVIRILASRGPLPPTIMVTGTGDERTAVEAMKLGARDYIVKDVEGGYLELLPSVIEQVLHQQRVAEERQRAEEALRESEERYRSLFERVPVGLYRTTPGGQIIDANPALVQMLGYPDRETLLTINVVDLYVDPQDRRREQILMERDGVVRDFEMQLCRRDGTVIWVRDSSRAILDDESRVLYYEGVMEDITARKRAEEERERLILELQEALARVKMLSGLLPICASCKKIRDDKGYWHQVEVYVRDHSEAEFTHGLCPDCLKKLYPEYYEDD